MVKGQHLLVFLSVSLIASPNLFKFLLYLLQRKSYSFFYLGSFFVLASIFFVAIVQIDNIGYGAIPLFHSPCQFLVNSPFHSPLLTWKPSFGVMRSRPPWSQVARKLTSPSPFPSHPIPILSSSQIPDPPGFPQTNCAPYLDDVAIPASMVRNTGVSPEALERFKFGVLENHAGAMEYLSGVTEP